MYPASFAASYMPRARMVFEGRVQIKAACSMALCCTLVFPIPSHDCCARLLLALFRFDVLADRRSAYAATAGDWQTPPWAIRAQTKRAIHCPAAHAQHV
jgi:hypothetical protein